MGVNKKRQATHIAPLQPLILAAFRPWGGSAGAGRVRPAGRKDKKTKFPFGFFSNFSKLLIRINSVE